MSDAEFPLRRARRMTRIAWFSLLLGLGLSWLMGALSTGVFHDDDLTHFQMARWAWTYPAWLLDDWGRPGFTTLYFLAAGLGWWPARAFSGLLTAVTAWLAYDLARRQRLRYAALVPALVWLAPMTFTLSYTTLTETALAFYLTLGMWLWQRKRYALSSAVISLCMITRHEGAVFLALWGVTLLVVQRRGPRDWLWLAWAPLVYNLLHWCVFGKVPFLEHLSNPTPTSEYGHGGALYMLMMWPLAAGLAILLFAAIGARRYAGRPGAALWLAAGLLYFLAHSGIYYLGLFASGGYFRFLAAVNPVVAVVAAEGLGVVLAQRRAWRRSAGWTVPVTLAAVLGALWLATANNAPPHAQWALPLVGVLFGGLIVLALVALMSALSGVQRFRRGTLTYTLYGAAGLFAVQLVVVATLPAPHNQYTPMTLVPEQTCLRDAVDWLRREHHLPGHQVVSANNWVREFIGEPQSPFGQPTEARIAAMQPGDLFIWDAKYASGEYHHVPLAELAQNPEFHELLRGGRSDKYACFCIVYERVTPPHATPATQGTAQLARTGPATTEPAP